MITIHQTLKLLVEYYKPRLRFKERNFVIKMLDGLSGLGDVNDVEVNDYLSEKQCKFVRDIGKRFHITEHS